LDQTFSTAAQSSATTSRLLLERSAAIATDKASFGSFLFVSRPAAAGSGGQLGLHVQDPLPGGVSCQASRCPRPLAPSTAQVRSGHAAAQAISF